MDQSKPARREFKPCCLILGGTGGLRHAATYLCLGPILVRLGHTSLHVAITVNAHGAFQINARIRMLHCDKSPDNLPQRPLRTRSLSPARHRPTSPILGCWWPWSGWGSLSCILRTRPGPLLRGPSTSVVMFDRRVFKNFPWGRHRV